MLKTFELSGPDWLHEIKYDGYRWKGGDMVALVEATDAKPDKRGPYKKRMVV
jgi:hypothetical protein